MLPVVCCVCCGLLLLFPNREKLGAVPACPGLLVDAPAPKPEKREGLLCCCCCCCEAGAAPNENEGVDDEVFAAAAGVVVDAVPVPNEKVGLLAAGVPVVSESHVNARTGRRPPP